MDISALELHDANLIKIDVDPVSRIVEIQVAFYPGEGAASRVNGALRFVGVSQFNQLLDLELMHEHSTFGNINQLVMEERGGISHLELCRGLISICAESVEFVRAAR